MKKIKFTHTVRILISMLLGIFSYIAISYYPLYNYPVETYMGDYIGSNLLFRFFAETRVALSGFGIEAALIAGAISYIIMKKYKREKFNIKHFISILFSILCLIGKAINNVDNIDVLWSRPINFIFSCFSIIGYFVLFKIGLDYLFSYLDRKEIVTKNKLLNRIYDFIFEKHPFIMPLIIISICILPYVIITYPGTVFADGINQLEMYLGFRTFTNHHPAISTYILGGLFNFGRNFINDNFGIFLICILQVITQVVVFSYIFVIYKKYDIRKDIRIFTLLYFMFSSIFKIYAMTIVKDTFFYIFLILFEISIYNYYIDNKNGNSKNYKNLLNILISGLLIFIFRNNGIYIILLSLFFLLFLNKNIKRILKVLGLIILFIGINQGYHKIFLPSLNIKEGSRKEMMSIPLQQTTRYLLYHPDRVSDEDMKVLEEVFKVYPTRMTDYYQSNWADDVKARFDASYCNDNCMKRYFKLWFKQFKDDPKLYLDSFLSNYIGYMYPSTDDYVNYIDNFDGLGNYVQSVNEGRFDYYFKHPDDVLFLQSLAYTKKGIPLIGLFYSNGFYSWLLIIIVGYILHKREFKKLIFMMPIIISWAFLFVGPVNAYFRYVLPVCIPIIMSYGLVLSKKTN